MRLLVVVHRKKRHRVYRRVEGRRVEEKRGGVDKTFSVRFHLDAAECGRNVNKERRRGGGNGPWSVWSGHHVSVATQRNVKSGRS